MCQVFLNRELSGKPYAYLLADNALKRGEKLTNEANKIIRSTIDSLHIACAIISNCEYFLSTDDKILKLQGQIVDIDVVDPIAFIKEVL